MVVGQELAQQTALVVFIEHDDVIEQFPPTCTDPALRDAVLPWGLW